MPVGTLEKKAVIADISHSSIHDGPGIRTVVFFKGCPLSCKWCHNPECIKPDPEIMYYPEKCIGCGKCDKGCYSGAKVVCGREMTVPEVLSEILSDKEYYGEKGGVTFSGGEPFYRKEFLSEILDACITEKINRAVETSLIYFDDAVLRKLDLVMADLKIWDSGIHKEYTGVGNETIMENFARLDELSIPFIMRTPVIPGIEQGIDKISGFARSLKNCIHYELLPYHPLGEEKRKALLLPENSFSVPDADVFKELKNKYAY